MNSVGLPLLIGTSSRDLRLALIASAIGHCAVMAGLAGGEPPMAVSDRAMVVSFATAPTEVSALRRAMHGNASSRAARSYAPAAPTVRPSVDGAAVLRDAGGAGGDVVDARSPGEVRLAEDALPAVAARFDAAYLANPRPAYPPASRAFGEQGTVFVSVLVSVHGEPEEVTLHASSGYPRLDRAALDAVRSWRFVPARRGESAVAASVIVPIAFTLRRSS